MQPRRAAGLDAALADVRQHRDAAHSVAASQPKEKPASKKHAAAPPPKRAAALAAGSWCIVDLPRELMHIITRLAPLEAVFFARANKSTWQLYGADADVLGPAVHRCTQMH